MYIPIDKNLNLGPNMWFAFTAITGISKLFTYTPPIVRDAAAEAAKSEGTEDTLDNKSL